MGIFKACEQHLFREWMRKHTGKKNYYLLRNGIECKDVVGEFPYNIGTAIAYLWRAGKKPADHGQSPLDKQIEDLQKAIDHIKYEIERIKKKNNNKQKHYGTEI